MKTRGEERGEMVGKGSSSFSDGSHSAVFLFLSLYVSICLSICLPFRFVLEGGGGGRGGPGGSGRGGRMKTRGEERGETVIAEGSSVAVLLVGGVVEVDLISVLMWNIIFFGNEYNNLADPSRVFCTPPTPPHPHPDTRTFTPVHYMMGWVLTIPIFSTGTTPHARSRSRCSAPSSGSGSQPPWPGPTARPG
jgi:hypothetical protein